VTRQLEFGDPVVYAPSEMATLVASVVARSLRARRTVAQSDGDIRYWGVEESQSVVLERLKAFGERCFADRTGRPPSSSYTMVNDIDAARSPNGSGGGWHRDSFRRQYKAFVYLTDVERESQGAFCFIPKSNTPIYLAASAVYWALSGANRYQDRVINALVRGGLALSPVLLKAGIPFFVNTSLIHRGLPITEGRRMIATLYMFEDARHTVDLVD